LRNFLLSPPSFRIGIGGGYGVSQMRLRIGQMEFGKDVLPSGTRLQGAHSGK